MELLVKQLAIWLGCPKTTSKSSVMAIRPDHQKTPAKSLVMVREYCPRTSSYTSKPPLLLKEARHASCTENAPVCIDGLFGRAAHLRIVRQRAGDARPAQRNQLLAAAASGAGQHQVEIRACKGRCTGAGQSGRWRQHPGRPAGQDPAAHDPRRPAVHPGTDRQTRRAA